MPLHDVKYKHLLAWDNYMGSYDYWKRDQQKLAEEDGAPLNAIYWTTDGLSNDPGAPRVWRTWDQVTNPSAIRQVEAFFEARGWGKP